MVEVTPISYVFALLPPKETIQYKVVLGAVMSAAQYYGILYCKTQRIMSDFEKSIINPLASVLPEVRACFFYLRQSLYRKIQNERLEELLMTEN